MNKKISIITINYNNLEGLKRTVESVVNQTWKEFEYVVIDGGFIDSNKNIIALNFNTFLVGLFLSFFRAWYFTVANLELYKYQREQIAKE